MNDVASTSGSEKRPETLVAGLRVLYRHMSAPRRRQFFAVLSLMFAGAFAELGTIGSLIPFIALLAGSGQQHHGWLSLILGSHPGNRALIVAASAFVAFAIVAGLVRFRLAISSRNFVFHLGHDLAVELQRRVLLQPYSFHVHRNSSTLLTALNKIELLVAAMLLPLMHAVTGGVIAVFVIALLVAINPLITVVVAGSLMLTYGLFSVSFRRKLAAVSVIQKTSYDERTQVVQESLGGIREVIIDGSQSMYLKEFGRVDLRLAKARATNQLIFLAPHYLIEIVGMALIATVALVLGSRNGGISAALPVLGTLVLGAQRLLPLVQDVYRGWSAVEAHRPLLDQVAELLSLQVSEPAGRSAAPLELRRSIRLEGVSLIYPTRHAAALQHVTLTIPRGSILALVGATGSGKSTLVDVLMGLLPPSQGRVFIDDVPLTAATQNRWYRSIAHVPQSIFLADTTIARNIALSLPDQSPDEERIITAAKKAQLHDFVLSLPAGYETYVGERGIRVSGGQRQRLGIARAIYKDAPILVLDEATSALDDRTEADVLAALDQLRREGRTIIIVAHRLSTVRHCDLVARLDLGRLVEFGPLGDLASRLRELP
jgi:ABC-type multidrug transport system fused ATPase/permease subunit